MKTRSIYVAMLLFALMLPLQGLTQSAFQDLHPLRPTDTSSPRDTLRSFLNNANQGIQMWQSGIPLDVLAKRRLRATETLNFSQVVDPYLVSTQVQHALLLKEVLDRITLPLDDQIPGDQEVADKGITRWVLPDTRITIDQVQDGPREGEFLFSARTVKQLEEIYLRSKHLPYKPGATERIYDEFLETQGLSATAVAEVRNRLKPVDTSSPRSTYIGFRDSLKSAYRLIMDADAAFLSDPATISLEDARQVEADADVLLRRAISVLDLSNIPKGIRHELGIEVALQLNEVLDRAPKIYRDAIPDAEVVLAWKRRNTDLLSITPRPFSWHFPNTEIEIVEVQEGPRAGEFLFSARTVSSAGTFYQTMEDLPYREGASEGFYEFFISTPGYLIPDLYPLTRWIDKLPPVFMSIYADQALWQWAGLVLSILTIFVAVSLVFFVIRRISRRLQEPYKQWLRLLLPIFITLIVIGIPEFVNHGLNITGQVLWLVTEIFDTIVYLMAVWAIFILFKALAETVISSPRIPEQSINANLLRLGARVIGFLVSAWILIKGVQELGVDVLPLLAGLGVAGLAVSLAARPTIENLIAGLILFADKPVRVGDRCNYVDQIGDIEHIGLRSTRVRSLERTLITIPNAAFAEMQLNNFSARDMWLLRTVLQLRYETTPEQLRYVLAKLRELLLGHPMVTPEPPTRVRFVAYGAYSKDVQIFAYLRCQKIEIFEAIQEDILLRIEDIITEAGTGFAFPSQTTYFTRDKGLAEDRGRDAESQVAVWREQGQLPFPEFDEALRGDMEDILDYPPSGSPHYKQYDSVSETPPQPDVQPVRKSKWKLPWSKKN